MQKNKIADTGKAPASDKKVLLGIKNLKQYFPIKGKKGVYVKANDDISLNIYEGETFGLVGESGCGKSTFGRVLLQLYHQTYGRTMYYGRTLDSMSPKYIDDTMKDLPERYKKMSDLAGERDQVAKQVEDFQKKNSNIDALDQEEKVKYYAMLEQSSKTRKAAEDAYLDIVQIIGGLITSTDLGAVAQVYRKLYSASSDYKKSKDVLDKLNLDKGFTKNMLENRKKEGGDIASLNQKISGIDVKINEKQAEVNQKMSAVDAVRKEIDKLRESCRNNKDFAVHDANRDDGIDLARLSYNEMRLLRRDLQLVFQDPYSSLNPRMTVGQIIGEGLLAHGYFASNGDQMQDYTMSVMEKCGLAPYFIHRYPHQFSGGQRQRICIARALAVKPKFVVCDEAVSALDVSIQSQVINLLSDLKDKEGLTYLFISHDLSVIKYISDRVGVMYLGNLVELASSEDLFAHPTHPYTEALLLAIPTTDVDHRSKANLLEGDIPSPVNPPKGCKFHTRCRYATDICKMVTPEFLEVAPNHFVACHHRKEIKAQ